jgi:hypothetical protein
MSFHLIGFILATAAHWIAHNLQNAFVINVVGDDRR